MGYYVNPTQGTKEAWLAKHGIEHQDAPEWGQVVEAKMLPVVLINNGLFTAAGIAYSEREYKEFLMDDGRSKRVFVVGTDLLKAVCPGLDRVLTSR